MKKEIESIKERNKRVEADKAWETSKTRRLAITVMTYLLVVLFLFLINADRPWLMALIPTAGYLLSTLLLSPLKKWWLKQVYTGK